MTIPELEAHLTKCSKLYYAGAPIITDSEFDRLQQELKERCPSSPVLTKIGATPAAKTVKLMRPMTSLDKVLAREGYEAIVKRAQCNGHIIPEYYFSAKVDGLALEVVYKYGELYRVATRGDGTIGQNVTDVAKEFLELPKTIDTQKDYCSIYGECYINLETFRKYFADEYANPRNAAAGILNSLECDKRFRHMGSFIVYGSDYEESIDDYKESLERWWRYFEIIPLFESIPFESAQATARFLKVRMSGDYQIDGVVMRLRSNRAYREAGSHSGNPLGAFAIKYPPERSQTKVTGVMFDISRMGTFTPVIMLEPVQIQGSVVSKASMFNIDQLSNWKLAVGDVVELEKAGDIIPVLISKLSSSGGQPLTEIIECPHCGTKLMLDGMKLKCPNVSCLGQICERLAYYLKVIGVKGVSSATLKKMLDAQIITDANPANLYTVTQENLRECLSLRQAENVYNAIHMVTEISLATLLESLGIPRLGGSASQAIARHYRTVVRICLAIRSGTLDNEIRAVLGGEINARFIALGLTASKAMLLDLASILDITRVEEAPDNALKNKVITITGTLSAPRRTFEQRLIAKGAILQGSVSKKNDMLIVGANGTSHKIDKAKALNVVILSEADINKLLG